MVYLGTETNNDIHCICDEGFDIMVSKRGRRKSRKERRAEDGPFDNDRRSGVQHNCHDLREQVKTQPNIHIKTKYT